MRFHACINHLRTCIDDFVGARVEHFDSRIEHFNRGITHVDHRSARVEDVDRLLNISA
jgi:hypothetical protein